MIFCFVADEAGVCSSLKLNLSWGLKKSKPNFITYFSAPRRVGGGIELFFDIVIPL